MVRRSMAILSLMVVITTVAAGTAGAQVLGTFRWQLAPYCNVLTLTVEQRGPGYRLDGTDNLCGASVYAAASGTAHVNPNGSVSIAVAVTRPDGIAIQHSLSVTLPSLSGTWTDDGGNGGSLIFAPAVPAPGSPRRVTLRGNYAVDYLTTTFAGVGVSPISFGRWLPAAPIPHITTVPTPECPGSAIDPQAAPGHLCVYPEHRENAAFGCVLSAAYLVCDTADRTGAAVLVPALAVGRVIHVGTWAVTLP